MRLTASVSPASLAALRYFNKRDIHRAIPLFAQALEEGEDPRKHVNQRWECWMLLGEFEKAWRESDGVGASFGAKDPLDVDHLLVRSLRGFGDAVQFLRYVPHVKQRVGMLSVQAHPRLVPLLQLVEGIDRVLAYEEQVEAPHTMECSDLPYVFRTNLETIPVPLSFQGIAHDPLRFRNGAVNVGLMWNAGEWNPSRAIPLHAFAPLWSISGVRLISLDRETEGHRIPGELCRSRRPLSDLAGTARLIAGLNLVISVDTLIAHLAGSLGVPVWTLLPHACDWRWLLARADSPWYPGMRLFRQRRSGDWAPVIQEVAGHLAEEVRRLH